MRRAPGCGRLLVLLALLAAGAAPAFAQKAAKFGAAAIQILKVESDEVSLPPEFQMALYENLVAEVGKTGRFPQVFRDGDRRAADVKDLVVLRSTVRGFKEGSARARQLTTVAGATRIRVRVQIARRDGSTIADRDVEGKVRFFGENLRATRDFAKGVAKIILQNF